MSRALMIPVRGRGELREVPMCYTAPQLERALARWEGGEVVIEQLPDHEAPSTPRDRAFILAAWLKAGGEPVPDALRALLRVSGNERATKITREMLRELITQALEQQPEQPEQPPA